MKTAIDPTNALLFSRTDSAKTLGVCLRTLDKMIAAGTLTVVRFGRRSLIRRSQLESLASGNTSVGTAPQETTEHAEN